MAHESFEDAAVADLLNREFVAVKVDREERPDVDAVYMDVCQTLTGSGGWPMTIVMTPDKKPFFAGTYFPKRSKYGMTGLIDLLLLISEKWKSGKQVFLDDSEQIVSYMNKKERTRLGTAKPSNELIELAKEQLARSFDNRWGGFGSVPKFPIPHNIIFLLRYAECERDEQALKMAEVTLEQMYRGGIFDHIGGGFSRYSTDEKWLIPHFEKMLYDNALLIWAYSEAFRHTKRPLYERIIRKTAEYVISELSNPMGAFLCGQDADSDGEEGKYYAFTPSEVKSVLGNSNGELFCRRFGIEEHGVFNGKSIPNLIECDRFEDDAQEFDEAIKKLYHYRLGRAKLHKDDKVLTSWNAIMIIAMAKAGKVLGNPDYLNSAFKAQKFIADNLADSNGRLKIRWKDGEAVNDGQLEDYAFYGLALAELYETSFDVHFLSEAIRTAETMIELFEDNLSGGFFMYSKDSERLITRPKPLYDGALPSGNSAAALLLAKLSKLTGNEKFSKTFCRQADYISSAASAQPAAHTFAMFALMEELYPSADLICCTSKPYVPSELQELLSQHLPARLNILLKTPENQSALAEAAPLTVDYPVPSDGTLYYLCRERCCLPPTDDINALRVSLSEIGSRKK